MEKYRACAGTQADPSKKEPFQNLENPPFS